MIFFMKFTVAMTSDNNKLMRKKGSNIKWEGKKEEMKQKRKERRKQPNEKFTRRN